MRKACVQHVGSLGVALGNSRTLSTRAAIQGGSMWKDGRVTPLRLHKFIMRFCAYCVCKITVVSGQFSPLSTPLIIRAIWVKEENLLIGHGG